MSNPLTDADLLAIEKQSKRFIVTSRMTILRLVAEVRRLREDAARYEWAVENWGEFADLCRRTHKDGMDTAIDAARAEPRNA
jgi:hypothetical protein